MPCNCSLKLTTNATAFTSSPTAIFRCGWSISNGFGSAWAVPDLLADAPNLATFIALGHDVHGLASFRGKNSIRSTLKTEALKNLVYLSQANAADLHEYAALGVAYSLVWDQPFPGWWPHRQVDHAAVPIGDLDVVQRFHFYVQANRDKKLDRDISQLSFDNLKYLVDSQVKLSELEYAQKNRISYSQFGDAFFAIRYDTDRISATAAVYNWPNGSYLLNDIENEGRHLHRPGLLRRHARQGARHSDDPLHRPRRRWRPCVVRLPLQFKQVGARLRPVRAAGLSQGFSRSIRRPGSRSTIPYSRISSRMARRARAFFPP